MAMAYWADGGCKETWVVPNAKPVDTTSLTKNQIDSNLLTIENRSVSFTQKIYYIIGGGRWGGCIMASLLLEILNDF